MFKMSRLNHLSRRRFLLGSAAGLAGLSLNAQSFAQQIGDGSPHIVIVGSGAAGISIANRLARALPNAKVTMVDRKETHYYWPGLTLVATGAWQKSKVLADNGHYLPGNIHWIKEMAIEFDPDNKRLTTDTGRQVSYDFMVVATGVEYNYRAIEGMDTEAIGQKGLASVYHSPDAAARSWQAIKTFSEKGGDGYFTLPSTPIRCAGAPLKMTFLTLDRLKQNGGFEKANMNFYAATNKLFGLPWFHEFIETRFKENGMDVEYRHELKAVDLDTQVATFENAAGEKVKKSYDLLHVVPPMRAPSSVRHSNLAWQEGNMASGGWLAVDKSTLQHVRYPEVFGCGDVNGTPKGKTAATVKMSVPIVVENLLAVISGNQPTADFNGYTSCPLLTQFGAAMLVEFDYDGKLVPTYPFIDPHKESWLAWVMKDQLLKPTYIQMLKGNV
jgi:sulfide:quinone oxidoreductase